MNSNKLFAANGSCIDTFGTKNMTLDLELRLELFWAFIITNVSQPILGADFIHHYGLVVSLKQKWIEDFNIHIYARLQVGNSNQQPVYSVDKTGSYANLLSVNM